MRLEGVLRVPSDKSISHRAIIIPAIAKGKTLIKNWLISEDTKATLNIFRQLGVPIYRQDEYVVVEGKGWEALQEPLDILDAKNSGTTARLVLGVLAGRPFFSVLTGDDSLKKRPMGRVLKPLKKMGLPYADGRNNAENLPIALRGGNLKGIDFFNEKASAQVKSAIILAGLQAEGITIISENRKSRDHTERMLKFFGAKITIKEDKNLYTVKVEGNQELTVSSDIEISIPADPSSAAFFTAGAVLLKDSKILLKEVLVNPTRDGFFRKLKEMGAKIHYVNIRNLSNEPVADIEVEFSQLKGVKISPQEIPSLIDEIPILAIVATQAEGITEIRGAKELRVKESDRIKAIVENLQKMGAKIEELEDGMIIHGKTPLKGNVKIKTYNDHRIAMAFTIAGLIAEGPVELDNYECVAISYPSFFEDLKKLLK
jgi:3-phosphoshikimate 1-carboxyvinyltransferase